MNKTLISVTLVAGMSTAAVASDLIDYPDAYRGWTHVKSMTIHPGHPLEDPFLGIHHIYANEPALAGLQAGSFADGSVLVFDQLEYLTQDQASTEGNRVLVGVMVKDSARFADTGGWGFEGWAGDSRDQRLVTDGGAACFACHTQRSEQDFVFSEWRD
jgi:hypothetical protein